ncbi:COG1470 family protein [Streptomyces hesseae]|uniref:DUF4397 domain-containing protein n=1 Tax=Streptomyces hesseae TaxID=3075519 RepID=A0ABU2SXF5_9ACTN|nr:hypothetical protein [Streptomyces sp. DSM 40473]MDT0453684.1 hypothetical protein [Streptomyces sp. DSM 40473]
MNWTRTAVAVVGTGTLWLGGSAVAVAQDGHRGTRGDPGGVQVLLNGAFDNRPGELIDIDVRGLRAASGATVTSPVFDRRVRLDPYEDPGAAGRGGGPGLHARPAVSTRARPGTYPLRVHAGGRVVAEEQVEIRAARRPEFRVGAKDDVLRPGEQLGVSYDDLYPGETGDSFAIASPLLPAAIPLVHDPRGIHWNNPRMFTALVSVPPDAKDGTYKVTLTAGGGRRVGEKPLVVRAARPGDGDYVGRARGPAFFSFEGRPETARAYGHRVPAGGTVNVLWRDAAPDPGEDDRLTATSPAFERPVPLRRDDSKASDGDDPRYYGPARVRVGLEPGRYPVTVISHHGRVKRTGILQITGRAVGALAAKAVGDDGPDPALIVAGTGAGLAVLAAGTGAVVLLVRRRGRATAH